MSPIISFIRTWKFSLLGLLFLLFGLISYLSNQQQGFSITAVQERFSKLEKSVDKHAKQILKRIEQGKKLPKSNELNYHLYKDDVLFGWSTNQLPIGRYKSDIFPGNGLMKLNNGYYFSQTIQKNGISCCVSFCLLKEYEFSNAYLSAVNPSFWKQQFAVNLNGERKDAIYDRKHDVVFYATPLNLNINANNSNWGPVFILLAVFLICYQLQTYYEKSWAGNLLLLIGLLVTRIVLYEVKWPVNWQINDWFSADFFAYNEWYPDFFAFAVNSLFIIFGFRILIALIRLLGKWWASALALVLPLVLWLWVQQQLQIVIDHSNIPLSFEHLFELRLSSYFFFALIGFFLFTFQKTVHFAVVQNSAQKWFKRPVLKVGISILPFLWLLAQGQNWINILPICIICIQLIFENTRKTSWRRLSSQLVLLTINAAIISIYLQDLQESKDIENRQLFAQQLAIERNINLELAYAQVAPNISEESWLNSPFDSLKKQFTKVGFEHLLIQKFFTGVWDGFDIDADIYTATNKPCFGTDSLKLNRLMELVRVHGEPSDIQDGLYFMPHEEEGLSYVILLRLKNEQTIAITLVSKRIPEEIGFPRLLISDQAGISNSLETYAVGKYAEGRLIHQTGAFNYPNLLSSFTLQRSKQRHFVRNGFSHVIVQQHAGSAIVISAASSGWLTNITSFAFMFVFWGLLLLTNNISKTLIKNKTLQWSLSFKVQLAFLLILAVSLFLYGLGSSIFIGQQFEDYSQQALREKLSAVQTELKSQTFLLDTLDQAAIAKTLETKLAKLSNVFKTDLFVFDSDGFLIASSRPKLFAYGLIGEHMNPQAMDALLGENQSYFSHQDQIGKLNYRSAYLPIMNYSLKQIGFINLQLFGQQEAYEQQIERFFKAAINVFVLLLALSVLIALVVSNWLIGPLQVVAQSVRNLELGKTNQKIKYQNDDEIGALVKAYNEKLAELELAAGQIARSERESAWRDLAQQIAHEIKNPLTPMKLNIQHLLRKMEAQDADVQLLAQKSLPSLIEQIDALARMANEFARFAKLPEPNFEKIELGTFITQTIALFDEDQTMIHFQGHGSVHWINADKDMLSQVFHNLLLNARQATDLNPEPKIEIRLQIEKESVEIAIQDNGVGISKEQQGRIFTPYFTTKSSGSGIGLSVVRQIIEKHNGEIRFESTEGKGTTFYVQLHLISKGA
jgi:two-component system, NtrC family, nitrogen regulation sensor histidine kinase NtrY